MEFIEGDDNEETRTKAVKLMNNFYDQIDDLKKEDSEPWRKEIINSPGIKMKRDLIRKLMETNLPACAALLDKLLDDSANNVFEYLEYLSARQSVAMSLESFVSAQKLAEKAHSSAKNLYQSLKGNYFNPDIQTQDVYNAFYRSCVDLFTVFRYQGRLENAKEFLEEAKNVAVEANLEDDLNRVHILEGELCLAKGLLNNAISEFFNPLLKKKNLTSENKGLLLQKLGNAYRSAAQWGSAKNHLRNSIEIARDLGDKISEYDRVADLANVYRSEGRIADAIEQETCHMMFAFERGDLWGLTIACFNMGFAYYSVTPSPILDRASYLLIVKYELAAKTCNEVLRGMALNNLGKVFCAQGQYDIAVRVMKECVEISKKTGNIAGEGMAYGNLGTAYRALGQLDEAIRHHEMYRQNASVRGDEGGVAIMQRELAWDYLLKKDFKNAEQKAKNSILTSEVIRQKLGTEDSSKLANFDKNQSEAYNLLQVSLIHQGKTAAALAFSEFSRARAITDIIRDINTQKGNSWLWSDDIFFREDSSQLLVDDVIFDFFKTADELNTNFLVYSVVTDCTTTKKKQKYLYIWLVKCITDMASVDDDRIIFKQVKLQDKIHGNLVDDERFFTSLTRSFKMRNINEAAVGESLSKKKNEEIVDKIDLVYPKGKSVERFVHLLKLLNLSSTNIGESVERSHMTIRKLEYEDDSENAPPQDPRISNDKSKATAEMKRYVDCGCWDTEGFQQLSLLYDVCVAPIEDKLPCPKENHVPRITIIPQEFLFNVPFCALYDKQKQYFIERCILSYAPSLKALYHLQQRLKELRSRQGERKLKLLAVGDPTITLANVVDIPKSGLEAQHVRHVFGNEQCQVFVKDQAKKSLVIHEIKNVDVLHLATHATPESAAVSVLKQHEKFVCEPQTSNCNVGKIKNAIFTSLIQDPEKQEGNYLMQGCLLLAPSDNQCNGILEAHEIANASCNCQFILLSCCETGLGKLTGDGVLGLYRAFFAAGAACILVTLWKIGDDITPHFMEKFYSVFKDSEDVPVALREAMLYYLREKKYPPHDWAAFSAVGASLPRKKVIT